MQNKTPNKKTKLQIEIEETLISFSPVSRNGWYIKFSTSGDGNVLLTFVSMYTGKTVIRHFSDEIKAVEFINYMVEQPAKI